MPGLVVGLVAAGMALQSVDDLKRLVPRIAEVATKQEGYAVRLGKVEEAGRDVQNELNRRFDAARVEQTGAALATIEILQEEQRALRARVRELEKRLLSE